MEAKSELAVDAEKSAEMQVEKSAEMQVDSDGAQKEGDQNAHLVTLIDTSLQTIDATSSKDLLLVSENEWKCFAVCVNDKKKKKDYIHKENNQSEEKLHDFFIKLVSSVYFYTKDKKNYKNMNRNNCKIVLLYLVMEANPWQFMPECSDRTCAYKRQAFCKELKALREEIKKRQEQKKKAEERKKQAEEEQRVNAEAAAAAAAEAPQSSSTNSSTKDEKKDVRLESLFRFIRNTTKVFDEDLFTKYANAFRDDAQISKLVEKDVDGVLEFLNEVKDAEKRRDSGKKTWICDFVSFNPLHVAFLTYKKAGANFSHPLIACFCLGLSMECIVHFLTLLGVDEYVKQEVEKIRPRAHRSVIMSTPNLYAELRYLEPLLKKRREEKKESLDALAYGATCGLLKKFAERRAYGVSDVLHTKIEHTISTFLLNKPPKMREIKEKMQALGFVEENCKRFLVAAELFEDVRQEPADAKFWQRALFRQFSDVEGDNKDLKFPIQLPGRDRKAKETHLEENAFRGDAFHLLDLHAARELVKIGLLRQLFPYEVRAFVYAFHYAHSTASDKQRAWWDLLPVYLKQVELDFIEQVRKEMIEAGDAVQINVCRVRLPVSELTWAHPEDDFEVQLESSQEKKVYVSHSGPLSSPLRIEEMAWSLREQWTVFSDVEDVFADSTDRVYDCTGRTAAQLLSLSEAVSHACRVHRLGGELERKKEEQEDYEDNHFISYAKYWAWYEELERIGTSDENRWSAAEMELGLHLYSEVAANFLTYNVRRRYQQRGAFAGFTDLMLQNEQMLENYCDRVPLPVYNRTSLLFQEPTRKRSATLFDEEGKEDKIKPIKEVYNDGWSYLETRTALQLKYVEQTYMPILGLSEEHFSIMKKHAFCDFQNAEKNERCACCNMPFDFWYYKTASSFPQSAAYLCKVCFVTGEFNRRQHAITSAPLLEKALAVNEFDLFHTNDDNTDGAYAYEAEGRLKTELITAVNAQIFSFGHCVDLKDLYYFPAHIYALLRIECLRRGAIPCDLSITEDVTDASDSCQYIWTATDRLLYNKYDINGGYVTVEKHPWSGLARTAEEKRLERKHVEAHSIFLPQMVLLPATNNYYVPPHEERKLPMRMACYHHAIKHAGNRKRCFVSMYHAPNRQFYNGEGDFTKIREEGFTSTDTDDDLPPIPDNIEEIVTKMHIEDKKQ